MFWEDRGQGKGDRGKYTLRAIEEATGVNLKSIHAIAKGER
jgi:hypothetical protein